MKGNSYEKYKISSSKKIDNVGRIQIPKYMKNNLKIKNGDYVEIYENGNEIIIKSITFHAFSVKTLIP